MEQLRQITAQGTTDLSRPAIVQLATHPKIQLAITIVPVWIGDQQPKPLWGFRKVYGDTTRPHLTLLKWLHNYASVHYDIIVQGSSPTTGEQEAKRARKSSNNGQAVTTLTANQPRGPEHRKRKSNQQIGPAPRFRQLFTFGKDGAITRTNN